VTGADPPEAPARQIKETYVPAASASQGEYRPAFLAALDWSLQLKMEERPQSILAFQEALSGGQKVSERVATPEAMSGRQRTSETAPVSLAPQPPHGNRGLALKWAAALIVIVGGIGGYLAYLRWSDDQAWEEATTKTVTIGKLEGYLKTFPNGQHAKEARQRVAEINRAQRKRADEQAWQEATRSDTVEAYKAYLKGQPNGIFKDAALARFEAIWAEVRRKAEEDRKRAEAERQREEAERKRAEEERKRAEALRNENLGCWNSSGNRSLRACTRIIESKSLYRKHFGADDLAKVYSNRGVEYGAKGQLTRAIADYTQAIKLNPRYADAYNNRSFSYAKKGQYDRAIADASQAIQINPRHALAYVNRGNAYGRKGYRRKAIADFRKALQIDPSDRLAKRNLKILGVRP
jgi:tetratricopeptide (TPR) repeat protein